MKIGITLPQFRPTADDALAAVDAAERDDSGIDGVFLFDHLWAIERRGEPAVSCWPFAGAVAQRTSRLTIGTLVARVGLVPNAVLVNSFRTLVAIAGARVIAGLGSGDRLSRPENEDFDIPFLPLDERLDLLAAAAEATHDDLGLETWIGGRIEPVRELARRVADALNLWGGPPAEVAESVRHGQPTTWGGVVPSDVGDIRAHLDDLRQAGATWAVCAPPYKQGEPPELAIRLVSQSLT